jgi:hypothetical protein
MSCISIAGQGIYHPREARDRAAAAQLAEFLATGTDPFGRDPFSGGHVTGSAMVLSPDGTAMVMTHHVKLNRWLQLGGHCDGIRDARFTAWKEAYEESGLCRIDPLGTAILDIDIHEIPARRDEPAHLHYDLRYLFRAGAGDLCASAESAALAWVPLSGLEDFSTAASVLRLRDRLPAFLADLAAA